MESTKSIQSSIRPKALAASFPLLVLGEAMDEVRPVVDRLCLPVGIEALQEMMEEDAAAVCGPRHRRHPDRQGYRWGGADLPSGIGCPSSAQSTGERLRRMSSSCSGLVKWTVSVPP